LSTHEVFDDEAWPGLGVVPLCDAVRRSPRVRADHTAIYGSFTVVYRAERPVHGVGAPRAPAGLITPPGAGPGLRLESTEARALGAVRPLPRGLAGVVVPGSALRQAVRQRHAATHRSCAAPPTGWTVTAGSEAGWTVQPAASALAEPAFVPCVTGEASSGMCPTCGLFGAPAPAPAPPPVARADEDDEAELEASVAAPRLRDGGLRGRVWFDDLTTATPPTRVQLPTAACFAPRVGGAVQADAEAQILWVQRWPGRLFFNGHAPATAGGGETVEAVPAGAELEAEVGVDGVSPAELGGLLSALGLAPGSLVRAGAGLSHGFGRLRPINVRWNLFDAAGEPLQPAVRSWRAAFAGGPDYWRAGEVALVTLHTRGEP
jgi:hypothetical protein